MYRTDVVTIELFDLAGTLKRSVRMPSETRTQGDDYNTLLPPSVLSLQSLHNTFALSLFSVALFCLFSLGIMPSYMPGTLPLYAQLPAVVYP